MLNVHHFIASSLLDATITQRKKGKLLLPSIRVSAVLHLKVDPLISILFGSVEGRGRWWELDSSAYEAQELTATKQMTGGKKKYECSVHGFIDVERSTKIFYLPPVLILHLMRMGFKSKNYVKLSDLWTSGHYIVYLKTDGSWWKFSDDKVTKSSAQEAIEKN